jgi:histidinol-phosphate aminotransferase
MTLKVCEPQDVTEVFLDSLLKAPAYALDDPAHVIKLDQNETAFDWPSEVKERLATRIKEIAWNRYPDPFARDLTHALAKR